MKQTKKISATMIILLAAITMMGEELEMKSINKEQGVSDHLECTTNGKNESDSRKTTSEPQAVFAEKGDTLYMSFKNPDLKEVHIEVRDGLDRLIYSETIRETEKIVKSFNFKNAFLGYYTIKLDYGSNSVSREIEIS